MLPPGGGRGRKGHARKDTRGMFRAGIDADEREMRRSGQWERSAADRLEIGLSRHLLNAYLAWLDDVMRELEQENPMEN